MLCARPACARSAAIPDDVDGFTQALAKRFAKTLPDRPIEITGPLVLEVGKGKEANQVRLGAPWSFCQRDRRHCAGGVKDFVANMSGTILEANTQLQASNIRAIVRGPNYIDEMRHVGRGDPDAQGIVRQIADGLWLICVIDAPHGISTLERRNLTTLGVTEDQAVALALKNVASALKPLKDDTHVLKGPGLRFAAGDFYEASRMLLHEDWKALSDEYHGHLVVAVPSTDFLIYGIGYGNGDRIVLRAFAESVAEKAPKPLSIDLYQWTPTGWDRLKPD
jgi:hypothetical protein